MADGDVKDLRGIISSIDENSKSTTDNINQILGILQNLDKGSISSNKKNNKKAGADNASGVTSMLKAVNNVTPKLHTFSTNISDINRGLKSLSNTISKFNQGIKSESVSGNKNEKTPRNAALDSTFFTDVKTVLSDIKNEIADFHKSFKDGLQDISNREVAESKKDAQQDAKAKKLNVKDIRAKQEAGERLTQEERTALIKDNKRLKKNRLIGNAIGGVAGGISSFAAGNIDSSSAINKGIGALTTMVNPWFALLKIAKAGADIFNKEQGYGRDYARTYGGGRAGRNQFMEQSRNFRLSMPAEYGYTAEDYYNGAVNISNNTGREIYRQSNANIKSAIDLKRMGIEGEELGMFDTFGRSMQSTDEYFNKLYGRAGSKGLSFKKMTDAIKSNLKMAQTYTFSKGVDGLQKMAETSTRLKYNMSEVARFAEKVNTVEGAIKTAANLSVLGGDFAQFSNPMGLLYESLNDMEGLNERMVDMFSKMARWDSSKGQIDISSYDKVRIRQASEAMGVDANEMMNIAMNRQREGMIESQAKRYNISGDTLDYVKNLAQLNKKGQAYISDTNNTLGRGAGAEILLNDPEFQKLIPQLKDESERKNNAENKGIGDVYNETKSIYDTLDLYLKGISGKLGALVTHFLGGSGSMTASQKGFWASMSGEEKDALAEKRGYASRKELRRAVKLGELNDVISEKFGGDKNRQFIDKNYDKYKTGHERSGGYSWNGKQGRLNFANDVATGIYKDDVNDFFEEQKNKQGHHVGIAGNTNEHFARILRGESVLTRRGTDILGKGNVRALNSGQLPTFEKIRLRTAHDYLNNLSVMPSIAQRYNQAQGQQKIAFEPITLTINGQFNVNSAGQFRNIPLDDIDTRALKKAILDTVTENIPSIMRKANILNNRGYDMENDRYRGAIQGSYI